MIDIELQQKGKQNWLNANYTIKELEENIKIQWDFLKKVHALKTGTIQVNTSKLPCPIGDLALEIRTLKRVNGEIPSYANHRIYNFGDKQYNAFKDKMLYLYKRDIPFCTYWSVYSFNSKILGVSQSGNIAKEWNNRIAHNNVVGTSTLVMDYDHITEEDFLKQKAIFTNLGIETIDIFSGHGYQCYILLSEYSIDKELLLKWTNLLLSKGLPIDKKINNAERIMRLTNTFNAKDCYNGGAPIKTYIINNTDKRYSVSDIFQKLYTLPTVKSVEQTKFEPKTKVKVELKSVEQIKSEPKAKITNTFNKKPLADLELQKLYPMLDITEIEEPIKLMLSGFQSGYANSSLMFLVLYFRDKYGYTLGHIQNIVNVLAYLSTYNYAWTDLQIGQEVKRFFYAREYKYTGVYTNHLQEYGYLEFPELSVTDRSNLIVNNYVFTKLTEISSKAFMVYLKLLIYTHKTKNFTFVLEDLDTITGIPKRTAQRHLQDLVKIGLLDKKRAYKKNKEQYLYYISQFSNKNLGFTKFNIQSLQSLINLNKSKNLSDTEFLICLYLKHMCYSDEKHCYPSQATIGQALGITQQGISKCFKRIVQNHLIYLEKVKIDNIQFRYNIELFY